MSTQASILVVDDDADVLTAARLLLRKAYSRVLTTENPDDIRSLMAAEQIDVFLLDMNFAIGRNTGAGVAICKLLIYLGPELAHELLL